MDKEKYVGNPKIKEVPKKPLKFIVKNGSIDASKLANKNVILEKLGYDVLEYIEERIKEHVKVFQNQIDGMMDSGIAVSDKLGSNPHIAPSLKLTTDAINQIWDAIRDMKGQNNDGITLKVTPDWFISEDTAEINISAWANDGVFETLQIYINDVPVWEKPIENVQRYEYTATMSETSKVTVKAQILGIEYTKEEYVTKYYPFFIGSGSDWEDIVNDKYARNLNHGKLRGSYNINIEHDGDYMFIIIPSSREHEIVRFDMNGYEIPIEVINNTKYTIYKSANTYRRGLFNIDITTNCECDDCDNN